MNLTKMLVLVATAAIVAMAFVSTSSAFAQEYVLLCQKPELECKEPWANGTTIVAHATAPKLLSSIGTMECGKSLTEITLLQKELKEEALPIAEPGNNKLKLAHILSLSFEGNCHLGKTACTFTVVELGAITLMHGPDPLEWIAQATLLWLGETPMETIVSVKCGALINCTIELGEETEMTATNGAEGNITLVANKAELKRIKGFCPAVLEWDATYVGLGTGLWLES